MGVVGKRLGNFVLVDVVVAGHQVGAQVGMGQIDPVVDHRHDHLRVAGGDLPGVVGLDSAHSPLTGQERVGAERGRQSGLHRSLEAITLVEPS